MNGLFDDEPFFASLNGVNGWMDEGLRNNSQCTESKVLVDVVCRNFVTVKQRRVEIVCLA